ncbi:MAG TPA: sialidase family protein [Streptosporangiaceae bacterium]
MRKGILLAPLGVAAAIALPAVALAASAVDVQANQPQVAGDPSSNATARFPTNKQNEPTIAVNPTNPSLLVAGANDEQRQPPCGPGPVRGSVPANDCSFFPGVGTDGVYTSSDGGASWTNRGLLPGFSDNRRNLQSDGDPRVVYGPRPDASGSFASARAADAFVSGVRAYYGGLAEFAPGSQQGQQAPELLTVSTSDNNGVSWSDPVIAANGHGFLFNDKEDVWVDRNPNSPFFGRVYVSWTQFRGSAFTFFGEPVRVAFSDDGGKTWSKERQLSAAQNIGLGGRQGSTVRTGPDGTVYVVWEDSDVNGFKQVVAVSHDGGVTFSRPIDIARVHDIQDPIPGANFRDNSFPSLAVDQSTGAVFAAWADLRNGTGRIVVSKSSDHGSTWSTPAVVSPAADGYAFFQGLEVAPNGRVDVGYQALKANATGPAAYGTGNATIDSFYVQSTNGGATWGASTQLSSVSSDPAASAQNNLARQFWGDYNTLVSTSANAFFIYTDSRNGAGCAAVDAFQHGVDGTGPVTSKPAPGNVCPAQFGNTDVFVSKITP